ncbi:MAG: hypothetical protein RML95_13675 [Anaerolineae bacterium]|nr:hypothetical protein [Anaerolineae bacterium]MDW8300375.1 hypothetical protein [Anaerolineae bacterium]
MSSGFKHDEHGWYYAGDWLKPALGIFVFLVIVSLVFKLVLSLLPVVIVGALILFSVRLLGQNGLERERWEAWSERLGERIKRWAEQVSQRAEDWAKQFEYQTTGRSRAQESARGTFEEHPRKRKNDEEVLEIEYEEVSTVHGKAKRRSEDVEYL